MQTTQVRQPVIVPALVGLVTLAIGVGLGFALPPLARVLRDWLESTPLPSFGLVEVLADLPLAWSVPILSGLGLVVGVFLALSTVGESLRLSVADDHLEHRTDDREGWVERADVTAVFRDGRYLVLLGARGVPRARLDADTLGEAEVQGAFETHRWPWRDTDPFEADYVRWVDGRPEFTSAEHALLRRRHKAGKDMSTLVEVDAELAEHGLAVRRRDDRLQVRRCPGAPGPGAASHSPDTADGSRATDG